MDRPEPQDTQYITAHYIKVHQVSLWEQHDLRWRPLNNNVPSCLTFLSQWAPSSLLSFPTCPPLLRPQSERRSSHGSFWSAVG